MEDKVDDGNEKSRQPPAMNGSPIFIADRTPLDC